jgi:hypothetical protein
MQLLTLDSKSFIASLDKRLVEVLERGVKAWLKEAIHIIPVWSGASHGTLKKLAGTVGFPISIFPVTRIDSRGRVRNAPNRIAEGESHSEGELLKQFPRYGFLYKSDLDWLVDNEQFDMSGSINLITQTPYEFIKQSDEAFRASVRNQLQGFKSNIRRHIRFNSIKF